MILISLLVIGLMFVSAVCAADSNNGTEVSNDLDASDDAILEDTAKDVNLTTREIIGTYGNNYTGLEVQVTAAKEIK